MKYEMPALGRRLVPLFLGWFATAVFLGVMVGPLHNNTGLLTAISILLYIAAATAVMVMAIVLIIQRYHNSLLGDEGYFSHALPVTAGQHIAGKAIAAMAWVVFSGIAMLVTLTVIGLFTGDLKEFLNLDWLRILKVIDWPTVLLLIVTIIMSTVKSIMAIYAALTIGHQASEHTILASIGAYMGVGVFETVVARIALAIFGQQLFTMVEDIAGFRIILLVALAVTLLLCAVYFFVCKYLLEKQLDLN